MSPASEAAKARARAAGPVPAQKAGLLRLGRPALFRGLGVLGFGFKGLGFTALGFRGFRGFRGLGF